MKQNLIWHDTSQHTPAFIKRWQHNSENLDVQDEIGIFVPSFELQKEACTEWLLLLWWVFLDKTVDEPTVLRELGQSFDTCWIRSLTDMALTIYVTVP